MVNTKLEAQHKAILYFWINGIRSPKEIHNKSNIPLCTENNLKKKPVKNSLGSGQKCYYVYKAKMRICFKKEWK